MTGRQREFAIAVIRHDAPRALVAAAVVAALVTVVRLALPPGMTPMRVALSCVLIGALALGAWALHRPATPAPVVPWIFAATVTVIVLWVLSEFWFDPRVVAFSYVLLVMVTYGLWLLTWAPFLVSSVIMGAASVAVVNVKAVPDALDWSLAFIAALAGGGLLMKVRLASIRTLADAQDAADTLAMTDALTGMLNRRGLDAMLPVLAAAAHRRREEITVCFVDIDGLKKANDTHGHEFGDEVIVAVADAVRGSVREGDLVARWGGDEFLVVGAAPGPDVHELEARVEARIAAGGLDLTRWPGTVTVGFTSGDLEVAGFDSLVTAADEAMYEVRRERRQRNRDSSPQI